MCEGRDQVASTSEKCKVQEEVATIKSHSLHTHSTLQTQNSGIPDELLVLETRDQGYKRRRRKMKDDG